MRAGGLARAGSAPAAARAQGSPEPAGRVAGLRRAAEAGARAVGSARSAGCLARRSRAAGVPASSRLHRAGGPTIFLNHAALA